MADDGATVFPNDRTIIAFADDQSITLSLLSPTEPFVEATVTAFVGAAFAPFRVKAPEFAAALTRIAITELFTGPALTGTITAIGQLALALV
jgi:hypothetical protein